MAGTGTLSFSERSETDFHIFVRGGGVNIWGGVLLLALAGAWWQRPEWPRKKFNKICFLGCMAKSETIILVILQI
jgi:prolipoprotein diacylglyceryltransferase